MKKTMILIALAIAFAASAFKIAEDKLTSKNVHINFYSHTAVEDITADNFKAVSTLDKSTGEVVFSVPMQSFEFEKALMQKHFNGKDFLNTKKYPKAKFVGKITNISSINFTKDGQYPATVTGEMTIKNVTKTITEKGTVTVKGTSIQVDTKMKLALADYGITFKKGKPSTNIAKELDVTVKADY